MSRREEFGREVADETCPGVGKKWSTGTGNPMCPACRTGWRTLGVKRPSKTGPKGGDVPHHAKPTGRAIYGD